VIQIEESGIKPRSSTHRVLYATPLSRVRFDAIIRRHPRGFGPVVAFQTRKYRLQHNSESFPPDSEDLWFSSTAHNTCSFLPPAVPDCSVYGVPSLSVTWATVVVRIKLALNRTAPCAKRPIRASSCSYFY
jgi:hypothetical protein